LPYLRAPEAQQLIDEATELLIAAHGYKRADRPEKKVNSDARDNGARADWVALTGKILRAESLHDSSVSLAASYRVRLVARAHAAPTACTDAGGHRCA
jgi:hypothetical protein